MEFRYWRNRYTATGDRIYIQGEDWLEGKARAWLEAGPGGWMRLRTQGLPAGAPRKAEIELAVRQALESMQLAELGKPVAFAPFCLALRGGIAPRTPRTRGRARASVGDRSIEAATLDLRSIEIPEPVSIRMDHREPAEIAELLGAHPAIEVTREKALPIGDYLINNRIIVERKACNTPGAATDFENSVINPDKRLFSQSEKIRFEPDMLGIILLEGLVSAASPLPRGVRARA